MSNFQSQLSKLAKSASAARERNPVNESDNNSRNRSNSSADIGNENYRRSNNDHHRVNKGRGRGGGERHYDRNHSRRANYGDDHGGSSRWNNNRKRPSYNSNSNRHRFNNYNDRRGNNQYHGDNGDGSLYNENSNRVTELCEKLELFRKECDCGKVKDSSQSTSKGEEDKSSKNDAVNEKQKMVLTKEKELCIIEKKELIDAAEESATTQKIELETKEECTTTTTTQGQKHCQKEETTNQSHQYHISLLFLTIDDLPHESIWRHWLSQCPPNLTITVICHSKFPDRIKSSWLRRRHITQPGVRHANKNIKFTQQQHEDDDSTIRLLSHEPNWGSVEIARAMIDLVDEGLNIHEAKRKVKVQDQQQHQRMNGDIYRDKNGDKNGDTNDSSRIEDKLICEVEEHQMRKDKNESCSSENESNDTNEKAEKEEKSKDKIETDSANDKLDCPNSLNEKVEEQQEDEDKVEADGAGDKFDDTNNPNEKVKEKQRNEGKDDSDNIEKKLNDPNEELEDQKRNENKNDPRSKVDISNEKMKEKMVVINPFVSTAIANDDELSTSTTMEHEQLPASELFLFLSESCLPIVHPSKLLTLLLSKQKNSGKNGSFRSWINARNTPNNGYAKQLQWDSISKAIPTPYIWKSDQWMSLNRNDALKVIRTIPQAVNERDLWKCFQHTKAGDEMYFATLLLGISGATLTDKKGDKNAGNAIQKRRLTYCDWSMNGKNPETFGSVQQLKEVVELGREEGCLFARKFAPPPTSTYNNINSSGKKREISLDVWKRIVMGERCV